MKTKEQKRQETLKKNRERRSQMICKSYELKIDYSHLNQVQKETLKMFFVEAKWLYNCIISKKDCYNFDYKTKVVEILNKDKEIEEKKLNYLPAKFKQNIIDHVRENIRSLSAAKKKGLKIGKLKFKSSYNSISLTIQEYDIKSKNRIRILGIKKYIKVFGLYQIKEDYELANAKLVKKSSGFYIKITTYQPKKEEQKKYKEVGIDFGIKNNLTTSEGQTFNVFVEETERLKRLSTKLNRRQIKGSNNRYKTRLKIQKEYEKLTNKKKDTANKIVHELLSNFDKIYIQDENIKQWKDSWFGKQVHYSILGRIKVKLIQSNKCIVIDRYLPTTKQCYVCGTKIDIGLDQRVYSCPVCRSSEDRDIKAAKTILAFGKNLIPTEHREFKPKDFEKFSKVDLGSNQLRL